MGMAVEGWHHGDHRSQHQDGSTGMVAWRGQHQDGSVGWQDGNGRVGTAAWAWLCENYYVRMTV